MINFIVTIGMMILSFIISIVLMFGIPIWLLVWIYRGFKQEGNLLKKKKLTKLQIKLSILLIIVYFPIAMIMGTFATDAPSSAIIQFWIGFSIFEVVPVFCLLLSLYKSVKLLFSKQDIKKQIKEV